MTKTLRLGVMSYGLGENQPNLILLPLTPNA